VHREIKENLAATNSSSVRIADWRQRRQMSPRAFDLVWQAGNCRGAKLCESFIRGMNVTKS
jgi:hypothetical protein